MLFQNSGVVKEIKRKCTDEEALKVNNLVNWLNKAPAYTTFRLNKLKDFDLEDLNDFLRMQAKQLGLSKAPNTYFLRADCLVLEQWPTELELEVTGKEVMVDAACAAAVLRGAHVFAPGVMGLPTNCKLNDTVIIYGDLDGKCKRGLKVKYEGKRQLVGTGQLKMLRSDLFDDGAQPSGIAVHTLLPASRLPVVNESLYPRGCILLQNLPSMVCGWVVNAKPNEVILDMCAAPGNKTTHLAEMSNNQATIIALDKTEQKKKKIEENCQAHGITCVKCYAFDSTKCFDPETINSVNVGPPFLENSFDKILLDAPCSGLGQRPQLINKITLKVLSSYKFVQRKLLEAAVKILKVGGRLVYSTCTITEDENEGIVAWALQKFPCLKLVPAEPLLGGPGWAHCGLSDEQRLQVQRFGPENDHLRTVEDIYRDSIGFFIASFVKIET